MRKSLLICVALAVVLSLCAEIMFISQAAGLTQGTGINMVSAGWGHTILVKDDGTVWTWGYYGHGYYRDIEKKEFNSTPIRVDGLKDISAISAGCGHFVSLKKDGTVWSWGDNYDGQLGDGTKADSSTPVQAKGMSDVAAISAGGFYQDSELSRDFNIRLFEMGSSFTIALREDGTVWGWGTNDYYQLGDGTYKRRELPVQVKNLADVVSISAGGYHSAALKNDGTVWTWGDNAGGQLGNSTTTDSPIPVQVKDLNDVTAIAAGAEHTVALKKDGTVWTWGANYAGQLGDGTRDDRSAPVKVKDLTGVVAISTKGIHTAVLKEDGTVWVWGANYTDQLCSKTSDIYSSTPVQAKGLDSVTAISAGDEYTMVQKKDGTLWAWGANNFGQLGNNTTTGSSIPINISDNTTLPATNPSPGSSPEPEPELSPVPSPEPSSEPSPEPSPELSPEPPVIQPVTFSATPTASKILVNGKKISFDAYNINGNNYFKLRDLAMAVNGTKKQFDVGWDGTKNAINLITNKPYKAVGGELSLSANPTIKEAKPTTSKIYLNGKEIPLTAYNINGNNYFKLRDIAKVINFGVTWDGKTNTIGINTSIIYTE